MCRRISAPLQDISTPPSGQEKHRDTRNRTKAEEREVTGCRIMTGGARERRECNSFEECLPDALPIPLGSGSEELARATNFKRKSAPKVTARLRREAESDPARLRPY